MVGITLFTLAFIFVQAEGQTTGQNSRQNQGAKSASQNNDSVEQEKRELARLKANYERTKRAFQNNRNGSAQRKAHIQATMAYGTLMMNTVTMRPQEKYPGALRLFREVLAIDRNHAGARKNIELIEGIYRSLGRPVPR